MSALQWLRCLYDCYTSLHRGLFDALNAHFGYFFDFKLFSFSFSLSLRFETLFYALSNNRMTHMQ